MKAVEVFVQCMRQYTENNPGAISKVHQRWRQEAIHYTVLEAPYCQMNCIDTVSDRIGTVTCRICTQTKVCLSR